jgi:hypothetical protein
MAKKWVGWSIFSGLMSPFQAPSRLNKCARVVKDRRLRSVKASMATMMYYLLGFQNYSVLLILKKPIKYYFSKFK